MSWQIGRENSVQPGTDGFWDLPPCLLVYSGQGREVDGYAGWHCPLKTIYRKAHSPSTVKGIRAVCGPSQVIGQKQEHLLLFFVPLGGWTGVVLA